MQKAYVVTYYNGNNNNLKELNELLANGWKVVSQMPMSNGDGAIARSLVIVEKVD